LLATLGFVPAGVIALAVAHFLKVDLIALVVAAAWIVVVVACWLRYMFWACPRCGGSFNISFKGTTLRGRKCVHCGVSRYIE